VDRDRAREVVGERFIEVFVDAPLEVCEERDAKGLYDKARKGEITDFTGISSPYEAPSDPDVHLRTNEHSPEECARQLVEYLRSRGIIPS
jgi:adenylylsulfate kinase-like enzyme